MSECDTAISFDMKGTTVKPKNELVTLFAEATKATSIEMTALPFAIGYALARQPGIDQELFDKDLITAMAAYKELAGAGATEPVLALMRAGLLHARKPPQN